MERMNYFSKVMHNYFHSIFLSPHFSKFYLHEKCLKQQVEVETWEDEPFKEFLSLYSAEEKKNIYIYIYISESNVHKKLRLLISGGELLYSKHGDKMSKPNRVIES